MSNPDGYKISEIKRLAYERWLASEEKNAGTYSDAQLMAFARGYYAAMTDAGIPHNTTNNRPREMRDRLCIIEKELTRRGLIVPRL